MIAMYAATELERSMNIQTTATLAWKFPEPDEILAKVLVVQPFASEGDLVHLNIAVLVRSRLKRQVRS